MRAAVCKAGIWAAIGGSKPLIQHADRNMDRALAGTCFVVSSKLNATTLALVGHAAIKLGLYPQVSEAWNKKYKCTSVWELGAAVAGESEDRKIKREFAFKHAWDAAYGNLINEALVPGSSARAAGGSSTPGASQSLGLLSRH